MNHRLAALAALVLATPVPAFGQSWSSDPAWYAGKAEWALYDAERVIYGKSRRYEATIFTNKQHMDPATTTKAEGTPPGVFEVFKHNVSEMVPTENYTYRFLTTAFVRTGSLASYKVIASTQEDCGATYKQFVVDGGRVAAKSFCYFPGAGTAEVAYDASRDLAFHDALTLTLRDYPFADPARPTRTLMLVPDQTDTHETPRRPRPATVRHAGRETLTVPYGVVDTHHLVVEGEAGRSEYWFAAAPDLRHVLVQYEGPYGVKYRLKRVDWWAYWEEPSP